MQNIFTNIKCSEIILPNANENWYSVLYDLFSRLCYIATCGPFCKDATHMIAIQAKIFLTLERRPIYLLLNTKDYIQRAPSRVNYLANRVVNNWNSLPENVVGAGT